MLTTDFEKKKLLSFVKKYVNPKARVLDVGCGYGRYLIPLQEMGLDVLGVEQNSDILRANEKRGLPCISAAAFEKSSACYDVIILSHIIEHFAPDELFSFLNFYLSRLAKGGYLIIATPLYSAYFYDDFDHIKPYHPLGLQMIFGGKQAQVQYTSDHQMTLLDIWFRKGPLVSIFYRAKYFKNYKTKILQCYDFLMLILFKISVGWIGRKDGWVGVFQKVSVKQ